MKPTGFQKSSTNIELICDEKTCKHKFYHELTIDRVTCPNCAKQSFIKIKLRSYAIAPPGKIFVAVDLSQAESWIVAYLANEPTMKRALNYGDIHYDTAGAFFNKAIDYNIPKDIRYKAITKEERYPGKKSNHAYSYRMSHFRFVQVFNKEAVDLGYPQISLKTGSRYRDIWLGLYKLEIWWQEIENELDKTRTLITPYGGIRTFFSTWGQELFKAATAHLPQRTVAEHFKGAVQDELGIEGGLIKLVEEWKDRVKFTNESHDSIKAELDPAMKDDYIASAMKWIKRPMVINNEQFTIPVSVEIGERWGELEEITV